MIVKREKCLQFTLFGTEEEITVNDKPTCEEINEYYKTHTIIETAKYFHVRKENIIKIIDPTLKPITHKTKRLGMQTEANIMFLKRVLKFSNCAIGRYVGCSESAVRNVLGRNELLKNLFDEYMLQIGNMYGERMVEFMPLLMDTIEKSLIEASSRKKIQKSSAKELVENCSKLHSMVMNSVVRDGVADEGEAEARERLVSALEDAIRSEDMDRKEQEGPYYQADSEEKEGQKGKE